MRFASLGSGSRGNATVVEAAGQRLLIDCGFPLRELVQRLRQLGLEMTDVDAVLVTHEHADHVRGIRTLLRKHRIPVWLTHGTHRRTDLDGVAELHRFDSHGGAFRLGVLEVAPLPVPHDACEPCQFVIGHAGVRLGVLTDAGSLTGHMRAALDGVDALILECNHDPEMLARGPYPPALQARVGGAFGHLSNQQAASLLAGLQRSRLRHLVAAHLSAKNNRLELARAALLAVDPLLADRLAVLDQEQASAWFELS